MIWDQILPENSQPLILSLKNSPAKLLTDVVPWKNVLHEYEAEQELGYDGFDDI